MKNNKYYLGIAAVLLAVIIMTGSIRSEPPNLKFYTPTQVWLLKDDLLGREITVQGNLVLVEYGCTEMACAPDNPCCNGCSARIGISDGLGTILIDNFGGLPIICIGDDCQLDCRPFVIGDLYQIKGIWKLRLVGTSVEYYLEVTEYNNLTKS